MVAKPDAAAPVQAMGASPLLRYLAGEFAGVIACIWRAPHADFLALPTARRHAAALVIAGLTRFSGSPAELRRQLEFGRDAALAELMMGGPAPGLMKVLGKLGETLWAKADYVAFVDLFAEPAANEALRHIETVQPHWLKALALIPAPLRTASVLKAAASEAAASDLAFAFRLAVAMRTPADARRLVERWTSGGDASALFHRAWQDLTPDVFAAPEPAPALAAPFLRVTTRRQLDAVALEFENCLSDHAARVADGRMAVYVWRVEPAAVFALCRDAAGWRLAEAKLVDNADLEEADLRTLVTHLAGRQVRTGPSLDMLRRHLQDHADGSSTRQPGRTFAARLELGDLWA